MITKLKFATSAQCVTGLTVVDSGTSFSLFGQLVNLTLIHLGGLGITAFSVYLFIYLRPQSHTHFIYGIANARK